MQQDPAGRIRDFITRASSDARLGPVHISLYVVLLAEQLLQEEGLPFLLVHERVMRGSRISSRVTFGKCLHDLHEGGYIDYQPSFRPGQTKVKLI